MHITYALKYENAAACLAKDRDSLLAFYGFADEHWVHLRTTNPIESAFATLRHRAIRAKGCLSNKTALAMVFKLVDGVQKTWRRLNGPEQLPKIIQGVKFSDGLEVGEIDHHQAQTAAESFRPSPRFGDSSALSKPVLLSAPSKRSFSDVSSWILACSDFTSTAGAAGMVLPPAPKPFQRTKAAKTIFDKEARAKNKMGRRRIGVSDWVGTPGVQLFGGLHIQLWMKYS